MDILINKPCRRTIRFVFDAAQNSYLFNLPFPYVGFLKTSNRFCVFFSNEYPTQDSKIFMPTLGNIWRQLGSVCLDEFKDHLDYNEKCKCKIEKLVDYFWNSAFISEDRYRYRRYGWAGNEDRIKIIGSITNWSDLSVEDVLKLQWEYILDESDFPIITFGDFKNRLSSFNGGNYD